MRFKKSTLSAPLVVTVGMLAACGGGQSSDHQNPPGPVHEHQNPPAQEVTDGEPTPPAASTEVEAPTANPPGHPDTPHANPPPPEED